MNYFTHLQMAGLVQFPSKKPQKCQTKRVAALKRWTEAGGQSSGCYRKDITLEMRKQIALDGGKIGTQATSRKWNVSRTLVRREMKIRNIPSWSQGLCYRREI